MGLGVRVWKGGLKGKLKIGDLIGQREMNGFGGNEHLVLLLQAFFSAGRSAIAEYLGKLPLLSFMFE